MARILKFNKDKADENIARIKEQIEEMMKKRTEELEAYKSGLKKIMTDAQYSKYEEDMKNMMQRRPRNNK